MRLRFLLCAALSVVLANSSAHAYLGGFEQADGYIGVINNPALFAATPDYDVSKYNAGQYGANVNPAATYVNFPTGVGGLWKKTMGPLMTSNSLPGIPVQPYASGHNFDLTSIPNVVPIQGGRALVITTNTQGWAGMPQGYDYSIDRLDLQGTNPAQTGNQTIQVSFYSCASISGTGDPSPYTGGLGAGTIGHTVSLLDGLGNLGVQVGYIQPVTSQDFAAIRVGGVNGGNWLNTGIATNPAGWHRWDLKLDLANDQVSIDYTPVLSFVPNPPRNIMFGTTVHVVTSAAMLAPMSSLEKLSFKSTAGVSNSKVWALDDFSLCVCEAPLSDLLNGGVLCSGDKKFSGFSYHGGGDMPAAADIFVKAITDADGNFGIRFQGAFIDAYGGGASDALIDYTVTAPAGKLISDVHLGANPLVLGGDGIASVTETFLGTNDQVVLSAYDLEPGGRQLTDGADLVDANGHLAPVQELHVQKDILAWSREAGAVATMSFIDQSFSQIDVGHMACPGDFDGDGDVDGADLGVWHVAMDSHTAAGDADGDGDSDGADFLVWQQRLGTICPNPATASAVPEPASLSLFVAATALCAIRRRRGTHGSGAQM